MQEGGGTTNSKAIKILDNLIYILEHPEEYRSYCRPEFQDTLLEVLKKCKENIGTDYVSIEDEKYETAGA